MSFNFKLDINTILNKEDQTALLEMNRIFNDHVQAFGKYMINLKEKAVRDALIGLGWTPPNTSGWLPIDSAPKEGMFIYAKPGRDGNWAIGLAYNTVSGTQVDHRTMELVSFITGVLYWHPLPPPP